MSSAHCGKAARRGASAANSARLFRFATAEAVTNRHTVSKLYSRAAAKPLYCCFSLPARALQRGTCDAMKNKQRKVTLLDLLNELQAEGPHSEQALVTLVLHLISSGQVLLCGNYANTPPRIN
jgi:hypothetical protein